MTRRLFTLTAILSPLLAWLPGRRSVGETIAERLGTPQGQWTRVVKHTKGKGKIWDDDLGAWRDGHVEYHFIDCGG